MGDAQLSAEEAIHNFYMPAFYTNFLMDIQDEQDAAGALSDTSPWTFGSEPADPAWGSAYPSILYWVWKYHDDLRTFPLMYYFQSYNNSAEVVQAHYASVKLYINFLVAQHTKTGLANFYFNYG